MPTPLPATRIVLNTRVKHIEERKQQRWVSGWGKDTVYEEISVGFYVYFFDFPDGLYVGSVAPAWRPGDAIRISYELQRPTKEA